MSIQVSPANLEFSKPVSSAAQARATYLTKLLDLAQSTVTETSELQALRDHAALRVQEQTFPSTRDEEWRFTDLSDLLAVELAAAERSAVTPDAIARFVLPDTARLVFVNGFYAPELSDLGALPARLTVGNLSSASDQQLQTYLGQQSGAEEVFTALNTAGLSDAGFVFAAKNLVVDRPIHLLFVSTASQPVLIQPRCLVVAEPNSSLTVIEDHISLGESVYFTNSVAEIWLADNAQITHTRIQRDSQSAFHIGKTAVSQARSSRYIGTAVSFGARLSRHNLNIYQTGEQTETVLNGLTVLKGEQVGDTHSSIALSKPYGTSRQVHKCIIDDRAHGIFNGKVFVPKAAQLTDAGQLNRTLLLSPKARVDTKPQLEIVADNVKCTHGATVGQLETDELFYLQSRGIDASSARKLLVYAFAYEILSQIPLESLRQTLTSQL
ncbi:Fe-S cluster assembly protein SufD [Leptolyngbya sp. NK1-12]|uniref:Fe-S cluster assembly protein SufD n=1 Tax=Leptolyngbya sp. NK1-12 TaxID=2547451 RepID=A0AA96WAT5_9CYAN|nr:Fe-S cluster assembly protein SufD [Leptolyngbya sp. NK1-12]WNZ22942.1 Fe-S cluster assembly protein SufD [Leptolyngbya sp. NK1-12]